MPLNRKLQGIMDGRLVKAMDDGENFGFIPVVLRVDTLAGAAGADVDLTMERKFTVMDVHVILEADGGNAGNKMTVKNTATAITDVIAVGGGGDKAVLRAVTIDHDSNEIPAGGKLRISPTVNAANDIPVCQVYITGYYHL